MTRHGAKKRPFFPLSWPIRAARATAAHREAGTYNPLLPREHEQRITLDKERIAHWLKVGAQAVGPRRPLPGQRRADDATRAAREQKKPQPRAKAQERMKAAAAASERRRPRAEARRPDEARAMADRILLASSRRRTACAA